MVPDRGSAARALVLRHTVLRVLTRIGVWQLDLPLDGCTDSHDVHHFCAVSCPRQGQHKHGGAAPDDCPHNSLPAAASLHTPPHFTTAQANRDPKKRWLSRAVTIFSGGLWGAGVSVLDTLFPEDSTWSAAHWHTQWRDGDVPHLFGGADAGAGGGLS